MESRCGFCFHPLGYAGACHVCGKATILADPSPPATAASPSASSLSTPQPSFGQAIPSASTPQPSFGQAICSAFGLIPTPQPSFGPASSSAFGFSTPQPSFGQATPPATSSTPTFRFSTPAPSSTASPSAFTLSSTLAFPPVPYFRLPQATANPFSGSPIRSDTGSCVFDDDEPVERPPAATPINGVQESNAPLVLKTHCELPAVARGCSRDNFAVLVHAKAPAAADGKAPLDLVTVLDVSWSMSGEKLALLKEAMGFVIDKLGPVDRLSVVSFSNEARRVTPLTRMSDAGKASTKLAVGNLVAVGSTDILKGLDTAAKVLDGRRHNAVASVILLSDGQDNSNRQGGYHHLANKSYELLVPPSLAGTNSRSTPIHTFGFGTDHDAKAMHGVAEATGGTYSFIENHAVVQDAFAQCIGGLLSVAVQDAWIAVACPHPDVRVRAVKSGRYESHVVAYGRAASVDVGELYADEERRFLLLVDVPRTTDNEDPTRLISVSCTYKDTATGKSAEASCEDAVVRRPAEVTSEEDQKPSLEVQLERFRVEAMEDIAAARAAGERGDHAEAARILDRRREAAGDLAGDTRCAAVVYELAELSARVATRREYEQTGRASMLVGMSSHAQQRAASVNLYGAMAPAFGASSSPCGSAYGAPSPFGAGCATPTFGAAFATPAMKDMVDSSRKIREERGQQQQYSSAPSGTTTTMPSSGSIFAANNGSMQF